MTERDAVSGQVGGTLLTWEACKGCDRHVEGECHGRGKYRLFALKRDVTRLLDVDCVIVCADWVAAREVGDG